MDINFDRIKTEYHQILDKLGNTTDSRELEKLGRRQAELLPMINKIERLEKLQREISEQEKLVSDSDKEIGQLAQAELPQLKQDSAKLLEDIKIAMLPKDPYDDKNVS